MKKKLLMLLMVFGAAFTLGACGDDTTTPEDNTTGGDTTTPEDNTTGGDTTTPEDNNTGGDTTTPEDNNTGGDTTTPDDNTGGDSTETPDQVTSYTITFDSNGGSQVDTVEYDIAVATVAPTAPKKAYSVFGGWVDSSETEFTFGSVLTENVTLTAKWTSVFDTTINGSFDDYTNDLTMWNGVAGSIIDSSVLFADRTGLLQNAFSGSKSNTIKLKSSTDPEITSVFIEFDLYVDYTSSKSSGGIKLFTNNSTSSHSEITRIRFNDGKFDVSETGTYAVGTSSPSGLAYSSKYEYTNAAWQTISIQLSTDAEGFVTTNLYLNGELLVTSTQSSQSVALTGGLTGINFYQDSSCLSTFYYDNLYVYTV